MANEREIKAAAEALAKLLDLSPETATEAARAALEAAERARPAEPDTGDFVG
jgi:hypothetical protein